MAVNFLTWIKKFQPLILIGTTITLTACKGNILSKPTSSNNNAEVISVQINQNTATKVTITLTNNSSTNNVETYTVSSISPSSITENTGQSTCTGQGPFIPGQSCTLVFQVSGNLVPSVASGSIKINASFSSSTKQVNLTTTVNSYLYAGTANGSNDVEAWNGSSWSIVGTNNQPSLVRALVVDSNGNVFAGGDNNVEEYSNGAWTVVGSPSLTGVKALAFDNSGILYAGGNNVEKFSGGTWSIVGTSPTSISSLVFDNSNNLFAATSSPTNGVEEFTSGTWAALGSPQPANTNALIFDQSGNLIAGSAFAVSELNGSTWSHLGANSPNNVYSLAYNINLTPSLYAGFFGGVGSYLSGTWTSAGSSPPGGTVALVFDAANSLYAASGPSGSGGNNNVEELNGTNWIVLGGVSSPTNPTSLAIGTSLTISSSP